MKRLLLILTVNFLAFSTALSTEQISDILIIENDTVYLQTFPLDYLRVNVPLLNYYEHPLCLRGYVATWQIIDDALTLNKVVILDSVGTQLNIIEYLENNDYNPKIIDGFLIADWYSDTLKHYDFFMYKLTPLHY